ncbi:MAG: EAL domain-containing protein [Amphritea sp.]
MARITAFVAFVFSVFLLSSWAVAEQSVSVQPALDLSVAESSVSEQVLTEQEKLWLESHATVIKVGFALMAPYLSSLNDSGSVEGISVDYLDLMEESLGVSFDYVVYPSYGELMIAASQGEIDVVFGVTKTAERSNYLLFTPVYSHLANKIFTRSGEYTTAEMDDFQGRRFAVPAGTALVEYIQKRFPGIQLIQTKDLKEAFSLLSAGQVDAIGSYASAGFVFTVSQGIGNISIVGDVGFDYNIAFGSQRDEPMLNKILTKALASISTAHKVQIESRWLRPEDSQRVDIDIVKDVILSLIVALLLVGLFAVVFWNRLLKREVATRKRVEAKVSFIAYNDYLTGVKNRQFFKDVLSRQGISGIRKGNTFSIIVLGLDRFRSINDTLGHKVGDFILQRVADRLIERVSSDATVARVSGDEFAVLITGETNRVMIAHLAEILIAAVSMPMSLGDQSLSVKATVGIACQDTVTVRPETVLECADLALHHAKLINAGGYLFHSEDMSRALVERRKLAQDLCIALKSKLLFLEYQPQVSMHTGLVCGFEALVRWNHPEKGRIPPNEFVQLAEEEGMIITLGDQVMMMACEQAACWLRQGIDFDRIAVNVSVKQFAESEFVSKVINVLEQTGLPAEKLELEITESLFMHDINSASKAMQALTSQGVQFAIDDFGTGFSSLLYLKQLPVEKIKLDQGFIREITKDHSSLQIVKASLNMGHALHMTVIAEGVEDDAEKTLLQSLHCDQAQGYLFSRPLPVEQITEELLLAIAEKVAPYESAKIVSLNRNSNLT